MPHRLNYCICFVIQKSLFHLHNKLVIVCILILLQLLVLLRSLFSFSFCFPHKIWLSYSFYIFYIIMILIFSFFMQYANKKIYTYFLISIYFNYHIIYHFLFVQCYLQRSWLSLIIILLRILGLLLLHRLQHSSLLQLFHLEKLS